MVDDRIAIFIFIRFCMCIANVVVIDSFFGIHCTIDIIAAESAGITVHDYIGFTGKLFIIRNCFDNFSIIKGIHPFFRSIPFSRCCRRVFFSDHDSIGILLFNTRSGYLRVASARKDKEPES